MANTIDYNSLIVDKENDQLLLKKKRSGGIKTRNEFPRECGVYKITALHNNSFYIGSSRNVSKRYTHKGYIWRKESEWII